MFYTREDNLAWRDTAASTLASAKRVASTRKIFQGTRLQVAVLRGNDLIIVAERDWRGAWVALVPEWQY